MSGLKAGDQFLGCPMCAFRLDAGTAARPVCPDCGSRMNSCRVTEEDLLPLRELMARRDIARGAMCVPCPDDTMEDDFVSSARLAILNAAIARSKANLGVTSKDGLLFRDDGRPLDVVEADRMARMAGFVYAEDLVKALKENT